MQTDIFVNASKEKEICIVLYKIITNTLPRIFYDKSVFSSFLAFNCHKRRVCSHVHLQEGKLIEE